MNVKFSKGPSASQEHKSEDIEKKVWYMCFVALSASYLMVIILVNDC